ncbi:MAG: hypothetical protein ABS81_00625 [Pseudonocardia sp. SCN 72-86]|nr:MAG: hypothetical protein ABS81_00625 [Pseudonocardia sp. SCN 72-86]
MAGYQLLQDVVVLEVSQFGPDALGGHLADLGATVIKVEPPGEGDPLRTSGGHAYGSPDGFGLLHMRWNRGKKSVTLDLKADAGKAAFRALADKADIVIEGMRAGVLERLGLGAEELRSSNPRLVFCSVSGLGSSGPYHGLGSHGPSFDGFGALAPVEDSPSGVGVRFLPDQVPVGMHAMGLFAAIGTLGALHRARTTGEGSYVEVAAADCTALWRHGGVDVALGGDALHVRPGFANDNGKMVGWPRLQPYRTSDGLAILFQAQKMKFWRAFCDAVGRPDLQQIYERSPDVTAAEDEVYGALCALFATRTLNEWMTLFVENDIPGLPVNDVESLAVDPHFLARGNVYEARLATGETARLTGTPIKVAMQDPFAPALAPALGADTNDVLTEFLGMTEDEVGELRRGGVID